jgi:hypothetical protein
VISYGPLPGSLANTICAPWLSSYEAGARTVEGLYPAEFIEVVEFGYPSAAELRARARDAARAAREAAERFVETGYMLEGFSILF